MKTFSAKAAGLGFVPLVSGKVVTVTALQPASSAEQADLQEGDVILAANDKRDAKNIAALLRGIPPGNTLTLRIGRKGTDLEISFPVGAGEDQRYSISEVAHPTEKQLRIRDGFLHGTTN